MYCLKNLLLNHPVFDFVACYINHWLCSSILCRGEVEMELARKEPWLPDPMWPGCSGSGIAVVVVAAASCTYCGGCRPRRSLASITLSAPAAVRRRWVNRVVPPVVVMLCLGYKLFRLVPSSSPCGYHVYNKYISSLGDLSMSILWCTSMLVFFLFWNEIKQVVICLVNFSTYKNLALETRILVIEFRLIVHFLGWI
jgi:hypothetical protein